MKAAAAIAKFDPILCEGIRSASVTAQNGANISGATVEASDSTMCFGVSTPSLPA
jgi:hypothetical protein